jgi:hypothetical protein
MLLQRLFCPCMILRRRSRSLSGDSTAASERCGSCTRVAGDALRSTPSAGREGEGVIVFGGGVEAGSLEWASRWADSRARIASMAEE